MGNERNDLWQTVEGIIVILQLWTKKHRRHSNCSSCIMHTENHQLENVWPEVVVLFDVKLLYTRYNVNLMLCMQVQKKKNRKQPL